MRIGIICMFFLVASNYIVAQNYAFGVKGGLTVGIQQWNGYERDPLFAYHGAAYIESADEGTELALLAQLGYHVKGSALRNRLGINFINNQVFRAADREFQFRNISLLLGAKQKKDFREDIKTYYMVGVRGEYTLNTNLNNLSRFNTLYFPIDAFVQPWNYGVTVGGGFEFLFSELIGGVVEFTINPDFSRQYAQPRIDNVTDPFTGTPRSLPERLIRNITFEISFGARFLRKVIYVD